MSVNKDLELLAPAGDLEKLRAAIKFGADAVYMAGDRFGMRKAAKNFDKDQLRQAVEMAHENGVGIHITLNIVPHGEDFVGFNDYVHFLEEIGVDAVIVSDPGVFMRVKEESDLEIHISTQASITNADTANFWHQLGAKRVVLARELSIEEIRQLRADTDPSLELEVFVHGAMCISYSGRCLLSNYMTGRDANQGDCAQSCRWKYHLVEEKRPGEYFLIGEDENGSFIMNSKDLCLLPELPQLIDAGVKSFKIEGRVKSQYYVSTVVHAYREALDSIQAGKFDEDLADKLVNELKKTSHRHFTKGFFYAKPDENSQNYETTSYSQSYDFIGVVKDYDEERKRALIEERNKFHPGDQVEIFGAQPGYIQFQIDDIFSEDEEPLETANQPRELYWINCPEKVEAGDLMRRAVEEN